MEAFNNATPSVLAAKTRLPRSADRPANKFVEKSVNAMRIGN